MPHLGAINQAAIVHLAGRPVAEEIESLLIGITSVFHCAIKAIVIG